MPHWNFFSGQLFSKCRFKLDSWAKFFIQFLQLFFTLDFPLDGFCFKCIKICDLNLDLSKKSFSQCLHSNFELMELISSEFFCDEMSICNVCVLDLQHRKSFSSSYCKMKRILKLQKTHVVNLKFSKILLCPKYNLDVFIYFLIKSMVLSY